MMIKFVLAALFVLQLNAYTISEETGYAEAIAYKDTTPSITIEELYYMYTGKITHWSDGSTVRIVVSDLQTHAQKAVILTLLGISISRFKEIIAQHDNIRVVKSEDVVRELGKYYGSLGIVGIDKVLLCTEAGLVTVRIVE